MADLTSRFGFLNRHVDGLPTEERLIAVIIKDVNGEQVDLCNWKPFDPKRYHPDHLPGDGYLGTAYITTSPFFGIGFHAWAQSDSEFVHYALVPPSPVLV